MMDGEAMDGEMVTELDVSDCWELLRSAEVGRLAIVVGDRPEIFPINHVVDHGTIVFRSASGTKLAGLTAEPGPAREIFVAIEVDGYDPDTAEAWSVVVQGRAGEISELHDLIDTVRLPLAPWQGTPKHRFVRIVPDRVTGRRFPVVPRAAWQNLLTDAHLTRPE